MARAVRKAADEILEQTAAALWIDYRVECSYVVTDSHDERKRPSATLRIRRTKRLRFRLTWQTRAEVVYADPSCPS